MESRGPSEWMGEDHMMLWVRIALFCSIFLDSFIALSAAFNETSAPYRGCFTKDIYQDWDSFNDYSLRFVFCNHKTGKIRQVLTPLEQDVRLKKDRISFLEKKRIGLTTGAGAVFMVAGPLLGPIAGLIGFGAFVAGTSKDIFFEMQKLEDSIRCIDDRICKLLSDLSSGEISDLEVNYLKKKKTLLAKDQDLIEHFFIDYYETGYDNSKRITDLLRRSHKIACICDQSDPRVFRRCFDELQQKEKIKLIDKTEKLSKKEKWVILELDKIFENYGVRISQGRRLELESQYAFLEEERRNLIEEKQNLDLRAAAVAKIFDLLSKSCFMALKKQLTGVATKNSKSVIYYSTSDQAKALEAVLSAASLTGQSFYIFNAKDKPLLDDDFLEGKLGTEKGLLLSSFLDGMATTDGFEYVSAACANPILIILNFDILLEEAQNYIFLNKMLDREKTTFESRYFETPVDCSDLSFICLGSKNHEDIRPFSIKSRLTPL